MKTKLAVAFFLSFSALAAGLRESFPEGKGSLYQLEVQGQKIPFDVSIYVAGVTTSEVRIEYFIASRESLVPIEMWQQFEIAPESSGTKIRRGFVQTRELKNPETLTGDYLRGSGGLDVNDFLFSSLAQIDQFKVGEESVSVPAGKDQATHYRKKSGEQTLDYWISPSAKPMGLVKLVSTHPSDPKKNYKLELTSLMKNVKPYIDPTKAVPLSDLGKSFLAKPESVR